MICHDSKIGIEHMSFYEFVSVSYHIETKKNYMEGIMKSYSEQKTNSELFYLLTELLVGFQECLGQDSAACQSTVSPGDFYKLNNGIFRDMYGQLKM